MYKFKYKLHKIKNIKQQLKSKFDIYNKLPFKTTKIFNKIYKKKYFIWKKYYLLNIFFKKQTLINIQYYYKTLLFHDTIIQNIKVWKELLTNINNRLKIINKYKFYKKKKKKK